MPTSLPISSRLLRWTALGCLAVASVALPARAADDAKPTPPATEQPKRPAADPSQYLTLMRERLNVLDLTADQKTKVDAIFAKAADDLKKAMEENKDAEPQARQQKMREVLGGIKGQLGEVLTDDQKTKLQSAAPGAGPGVRTPGAGMDALNKNLEKLGLTDDQKAKIKTLMDDTKKAIEDLRAEAQKDGNRDAVREKGQTLGQDFRTHLMEILTPEQAAKLKELSPARPGAPTEKSATIEKKGT